MDKKQLKLRRAGRSLASSLSKLSLLKEKDPVKFTRTFDGDSSSTLATITPNTSSASLNPALSPSSDDVEGSKATLKPITKASSFLSLSYLRGLPKVPSVSRTSSSESISQDDNSDEVLANARLSTEAASASIERSYKLICRPLHVHYDRFGNRSAQLGVAEQVGGKDQDRFDVRLNEFYYLSVFDGHGTSSYAADLCMDQLYPRIMSNMENEKMTFPSNKSIQEAYEAMDEIIFESTSPDHLRTGTCAATVVVEKEQPQNTLEGCDENVKVKVAWAGDCRVVMFRENGSVEQLTIDHRVHDNESEVERIQNSNNPPREDLRISPEQKADPKVRKNSFVGRRMLADGTPFGSKVVFAHDGGTSLQISRSIGDKTAARSVVATPEFADTTFKSGEFTRFVVASDGLFDVFTNKAVAKVLNKYPKDPRKAAQQLAKAAKRKRLYGGKSVDDITVLVFDINPPGS